MTRRKDDELRASVERLQLRLGDYRSLRSAYDQLLTELMKLSHSRIGIIVEPRVAYNPKLGLVPCAILAEHAAVKLDLEKAIRNEPLDFLTLAFRTGNADIIHKSELFKVFNSAMVQYPSRDAIVLPILDQNVTTSVVCLFGRAQSYSLTFARRCWPLFTTVTAIRRRLISDSAQGQVSLASDLKIPNTDPFETLSLVEHSCPTGIIEVNQNLKITSMNPSAERTFNVKAGEVLDCDIDMLLPERFPNEHRQHTFTDQNVGRSNEKARFAGRRSDQSIVQVDVVLVPRVVNGQKHHFIMVQDNSDIEEVKAEIDSQAQRFKAVTDLAPVGILQVNRKWDCTYVNDRWCEICQMSNEEVQGRGWIDAIYHEDLNDTLHKLHAAATDGYEFKRECRIRTRLGEIIWVDFQARPLPGHHCKTDGFIATLNDVTYRHITEEKLRNMAEIDGLTGLANRELLRNRLKQALLRVDRYGALALLCLDLDDFKKVNDSLGHEAGDRLLCEVANRLSSCVRNDDTVARIGGDEFMILIEGIGEPSAVATVCEKILKTVSSPVLIDHQEQFISCSIGISFCMTEEGASITELMKQSDIALYRAKDEGRNNYQYYSPELEQASQNRLETTNYLHRALHRDEFKIHYQLQADVSTGELVGVEALMRWCHPVEGLIQPAKFIYLLEETGLIVPVGNWLVSTVVADFKSWIDAGLLTERNHVSLNLAAKQIKNLAIVNVFEEALSKYQVPGASVIAEITETTLLDESREVNESLNKLKELGVKIALDDFGTGYSSLTYLKKFPIDILKIDKSFVQNIIDDKNDAVITQGVITLAQSLGLISVAEGVETLGQLEKLKNWNCNIYQGYLLGEPQDRVQTAQTLANFNENRIDKLA